MKSINFARTTSGKNAQHRFHSDTIVVWVEGRTDYSFFEPLTRSKECTLRWAGGREECEKVGRATISDDLPYVIIIDGDYSILHEGRNDDPRIIVLTRYSIENYCAEPGLMETVCRLYSEGEARGTALETRFGELLDEIESGLRELVIRDVAMQRSAGRGRRVLPGSALELLEKKEPPRVNLGRVEALLGETERSVGAEGIEEAKQLVMEFVRNGRFVDVLRGHLVFDLMRWFILGELKRVGLRATFDNRVLRASLGAELWKLTETDDHETLRRCVEEGLQDAARAKGKWKRKVKVG